MYSTIKKDIDYKNWDHKDQSHWVTANFSKKVFSQFPVLVYTGCALSILLVIAVGLGSWYFSNKQKNIENWVEHTYTVLNKVESVHHHLSDLSDARHDFTNTGFIDFYRIYNRKSALLSSQLDTLHLLVKDNPEQKSRIDRIGYQINNLLNFWRTQNETLFKSKGKMILQAAPEENIKIDRIRSDINALKEAERNMLLKREYENQQLRVRTLWAIITGIVLILMIVAFLIYLILNEFKNRINAYQKEKEISELKSNFVSLASHEFRTPLSSVLLSANLIEKYAEKNDTANLLKHSHKIKSSVNNLSGILEDFLSLEKLDTGKVKPVFAPFKLRELCEDIIEDMQVIKKPDQNLLYLPEGPDEPINLDIHLIRNAIINLVSNAIKYAGDNTRILLKTTISTDHISISVKDNGIGIAEKDQKNLFKPFFRGSSDGNIPGTGLGLNIVLRYVQLMNGNLTFTSAPQHETSFTMTFPV